MLDVFARVKLLFDKDKDFRAELAGILGFLPLKIELYKVAFSHSSSQYRSPKGGKRLNNERLEFLGDAVLEAVVSDLVFHHFENKREGFLTNTRSKIVQRSTLNELATEMGVDRLLRTGARGQSHNSNIGGNAFEALIGAIYLDRGYRACKKFVEKQIMRKFVNMDDVAQKEVNFKSKILEYCQKNRINCEFKLKNIDKSDANSPVFRSILDIEGVMVGEGKGYSKKESEQGACRDALLRMRRSQALVAQIFDAKEARTSTEAPIFVAVPKIDEIEEEIAKMSEAKTERRRQQRQRQKERKDEQAKEQQKAEPAKSNPQENPVEETPKSDNKKEEEQTAQVQVQEKPAQKAEEKAEDTRTSRRRKPKSAENQVKEQNGEKPAGKPVVEKPVAAKTEDINIVPVSLKPVQPKVQEEPIPAPLFMLSDIKKKVADSPESESENSEANVGKKPRRSRRKPKAAPVEEVEASVKETEKDADTTAPVKEEETPEKKPRRISRRRKPTGNTDSTPSKAASKKADANTSDSEVPTLPFAPQE